MRYAITHTSTEMIAQPQHLALPQDITSIVIGVDSFDPLGAVTLSHRADGKRRSCHVRQCLSVNTAKTFQAWCFVKGFPDGTLFLTGGEFLVTLGMNGLETKMGALYSLDVEDSSITLLQQG